MRINNHTIITLTCAGITLLFTGLFMQNVAAATFEFNPATASIPSACSYEVSVMVDTQGAHSNAADIEIHFDPAQLTVLDSNANIPGVQVRNGSAYDSYVYNNVDNSTGIIRVAAGSLMGELVGRNTFIYIKFQAKAGASVANFTIYYTGANDTLDSNVADTTTNLDLLTGVTNGSYTFNSTSCAPDTIAPIITVYQPSESTLNGKIVIDADLTDEKSGVNISTFQAVINGEVYNSSNSLLTYSGDKFHYTLTIDPNLIIDKSSPTMILLTVKDNAGNMGTRIIYLNFPSTTPVPTITSTPVVNTPTVTPSVTPEATTVPSPTPNITKLPETGPTPTACPVYDNKTCQEIINSENEKNSYFNVNSLDGFSIALGKINLWIPGIGLLALIGLILNVLSGYYLIAGFIAYKKQKNNLHNYIGIVFDDSNDEEVPDANVVVSDIQGIKLSETTTDNHGRYFFKLTPGDYQISITADNFEVFKENITYNKGNKLSYHRITREDKQSLKTTLKKINKLFQQEALAIVIVAYILTIAAFVLSPNLFTLGLFIINTVLFLATKLLKLSAYRRNNA